MTLSLIHISAADQSYGTASKGSATYNASDLTDQTRFAVKVVSSDGTVTAYYYVDVRVVDLELGVVRVDDKDILVLDTNGDPVTDAALGLPKFFIEDGKVIYYEIVPENQANVSLEFVTDDTANAVLSVSDMNAQAANPVPSGSETETMEASKRKRGDNLIP